MKKTLLVLFVVLLLLVGCKGSTLKDGTFEGNSLTDDKGEYGKVIIVVKDNEIKDVTYNAYQKDGSIKDENYGKNTGNEKFYKKAQIAVSGIKDYPKQLKEKQILDDVEAVSGATISFKQFREAAEDAINKASK